MEKNMKCLIVADKVKFTEGDGERSYTFDGALAYAPDREMVVPVLNDDEMERYAELFNEDSRSDEQPWMYGFIADMCGSYAYFDTSDAVPVDMVDFPVYEDVTTGIKLHCPTPSTDNSMEILEMPAWEYRVGGMSGTVDMVDVWTVERTDCTGYTETCYASFDHEDALRVATDRLTDGDGWFYRIAQN